MCGSPKINLPATPPPTPPTPRQIKAEETAAMLSEINLQDALAEREARKKQIARWQELTGKTPEEWETEETLKNTEVANLYRTQVQQALEGKLPVSPTLTAAMEEEQGQLEELLLRGGSRPGDYGTREAVARGELSKRQEQVKEWERRGILDANASAAYLASPLSYVPSLTARSRSQTQLPVGLQDVWQQQNQYRTISDDFSRMGYSAQVQAAIENARMKGQAQQGMMGAIGGLLGTGLGIAGMKFLPNPVQTIRMV